MGKKIEFESLWVIIKDLIEEEIKENSLIQFNLAKMKRNCKFKDEFEINGQIKKSIRSLIEEEN